VTSPVLGSFLWSFVAHAESAVAVPMASADALAAMRMGNLLWGAGQVFALAIPFLCLVTGLGARMRTTCSRLAHGRWFLTVVLFTCAYFTFAALLTAPLECYRDFLLPHSLGLSQPTLSEWLRDEGVQLAVRLVAASVLMWVPYALIARSPRRWWLYGALALLPVALVALLVVPVWVAPLTHHYQSLGDAQLQERIEALAARCGVSRVPVFVGGDDTTVVGLGPTNRIVLQADLANAETPDQVDFTIAHELKHYVLGDNWKALAIIAFLLLAGFWTVNRLGRGAIRRWSPRFGFSDLADPASLPLVAGLLTALWLCTVPLFNLFARHIEHEADRFGLELTHQNHAVAAMFAHEVDSGEVAEWDAFFRVFRATHPSRGERIRFANTYQPWAQGAPLAYDWVCSRSDQGKP
jgi:STE24 endopeptidase